MSRIVVTGGAGRLGRSLVAGLAGAGHELISLDRAVSAAPELADVAQVAVDLTDPDAAARAIADARADALVHLAAIAVPFSAPEDVILRTNATLALNVLSSGVAAGIPKIVTASSPTVLGYGAPTGWLPERFPLDEETAAEAVERLRAVEAPRRADDRDARAADRRRHPVRRVPPLLRDRPRRVGGRADAAGPHRPRAPGRPGARRRPPCSTTSTRGMSRPSSTCCSRPSRRFPNAEVFFVGADDALAREPLAELLPRFVPGSDDLAAVLTGTAPAFSNAKARRVLGWRPAHHWRDELPPRPTTSTRKDAPEWTSTASSSSR